MTSWGWNLWSNVILPARARLIQFYNRFRITMRYSFIIDGNARGKRIGGELVSTDASMQELKNHWKVLIFLLKHIVTSWLPYTQLIHSIAQIYEIAKKKHQGLRPIRAEMHHRVSKERQAGWWCTALWLLPVKKDLLWRFTKYVNVCNLRVLRFLLDFYPLCKSTIKNEWW